MRLTVPVECVADGCRELNSGSGLVAEALLFQQPRHANARYALLIDAWIVDTKGNEPAAWESDELFPGTCSQPALGRAYLNNQGYFPFTLSTLRRTAWSIAVFDGTTMIGCGSHPGTRALQTNAAPLPDAGKMVNRSGALVVSVGGKNVFGRQTITVTPAHDELGLPVTHLVLRFNAFGGSSDIAVALRRGTCRRLRPSPDVQLPDLVPDDQDTWATATANVRIPYSTFESQNWVVELGGGDSTGKDDGTWFGDGRSICAAVTRS